MPKPQTHTCGPQASVAVPLIMKKTLCSFYSAYVLCRNLMTQNEKEAFVIAMNNTPLPSSGTERDCK